jgi:hypothetical protein
MFHVKQIERFIIKFEIFIADVIVCLISGSSGLGAIL